MYEKMVKLFVNITLTIGTLHRFALEAPNKS